MFRSLCALRHLHRPSASPYGRSLCSGSSPEGLTYPVRRDIYFINMPAVTGFAVGAPAVKRKDSKYLIFKSNYNKFQKDL